MEKSNLNLSYQPSKTPTRDSWTRLLPFKSKPKNLIGSRQSTPYAYFMDWIGQMCERLPKLNLCEEYTCRRRGMTWKLCNPTIEDYNRSMTHLSPPTKSAMSSFNINEELYYKIRQHQKVFGITHPDTIKRSLNRTLLNCRTVIA